MNDNDIKMKTKNIRKELFQKNNLTKRLSTLKDLSKQNKHKSLNSLQNGLEYFHI